MVSGSCYLFFLHIPVIAHSDSGVCTALRHYGNHPAPQGQVQRSEPVCPVNAKQSPSIQIRTPGSQRCGQVTDLSLPKKCVILEIIQHRRDRFSEANLSALSMQNPNSNPGIAALRTGH